MNKIISSRNNEIYKSINNLNKRKYRYKEEKFLIEGKKLVEEAIQSNVVIEYFVYDNKKVECFNIDDTKDNLILEGNLFNELSSMEKPEGIIAVCKFIKKNDKLTDNILILDQLNDPGNLGTIIRSSEAFGFDTILLTKGSVDIYNSKVLRGAMGTIFRQNIKYIDYKDILNLKDKGYKVFSMALENTSINLEKVDFVEKLAIVIGNEANGISEEMKKITDEFLIIPMQGKVESLNAGVAASITMFYFNTKGL